jgi:hypothetical protein
MVSLLLSKVLFPAVVRLSSGHPSILLSEDRQIFA